MSQNLWCQSLTLFTAWTLCSAALLHLLLPQSLHCLFIFHITYKIAFLALFRKGEVFCLFALSTSSGCSASTDFFFPTSCSSILLGTAARMTPQTWQSLWFWAQCLAHKAKSLVPGMGLPEVTMIGFSCRLTKWKCTPEHQLYMKRISLTVCLHQVSLST